MSEEPLSAKCPKCKYRVTLGAANSILMLYEKQRYMSVAHVTCPRPQCEHEWNTFFNADEPEAASRYVALALYQGWTTRRMDRPSAEVIRQYEECIGYTLLEPVELQPRHEQLIESLRVTLEMTPDHHLMDIFESPPPKSNLPKEWC